MRRSFSLGFRSVSLGLTALALGFVGCGGGGDDGDRPDDTGGTGGTGAAGGTGAMGGTGGATGGSAGATGGSAGSATGGSGGAAGSGGSGGCPMCDGNGDGISDPPTACSTLAIPSEVVNDFENLLPTEDPAVGIFGANDETGMPRDMWWTGYFSGSFSYPAIPEACSGEPTPATLIERTDVDGSLHITGSVGTYSGFGVWLGDCIIDMSAYATGISFLMGGNVGASGMLKFSVQTVATSAPDACRTGRGTCDAATAGTCTAPSLMIAVPATPEAITVEWSELTGGVPEASPNPAEILGFQWDFEFADGMAAYDVDLTLDDVVLVP